MVKTSLDRLMHGLHVHGETKENTRKQIQQVISV